MEGRKEGGRRRQLPASLCSGKAAALRGRRKAEASQSCLKKPRRESAEAEEAQGRQRQAVNGKEEEEEEEEEEAEANLEAVLRLLPRNLAAALLPFQKEGVAFAIKNHGRVLIGDEMGLGKTVQAIATAWFYRDDWPLLIIVPSSVKGSWIDELEKWLPVLQPTDFNIVRSGTDVARLNRRVTLVTYGLLTQSTLAAHIAQAGFKAVIVDESHYIKNRKAKRSKTFAHFICMRERVCVCVLGE